MTITRKELSQILTDTFESMDGDVDSPISFHFKGFSQSFTQRFLDHWCKMTNLSNEQASKKVNASYDHASETIQCWFYYNDYDCVYHNEESESVIGFIDNE